MQYLARFFFTREGLFGAAVLFLVVVVGVILARPGQMWREMRVRTEQNAVQDVLTELISRPFSPVETPCLVSRDLLGAEAGPERYEARSFRVVMIDGVWWLELCETNTRLSIPQKEDMVNP